MPWEIQDNVVCFTTSVASEAGVVIVAFTVLAVRVLRRALEGDVVSVAIYVDLVSDEFARHWLEAGHLFHITFVSPGTCDDDATSVRALFSCFAGFESTKEDDKQHCRIVLGCVDCLVATGGKDLVESVGMVDENMVWATGHAS